MNLRDNITLSNDYEDKYYKKVIKVCALEHDLKLMPDGDRT